MPIGSMDGPSRAGGAGTHGGPGNIDPGHLLIGVGALMLLVSLFLEWYSPSAEAWDVFEVWDLVLAALAILALAAVASRFGIGRPRPASWLIGASVAALVIVVYALIDPPPAAQVGSAGTEFGDPGTGLWLALVAAILMTAGTLLSVARISVAFSGAAGPGGGDSFGRPGGGDTDPHGPNPVVPQPQRAGEPGYREQVDPRGGGGLGQQGAQAGPNHPAGPGSVPPTEQTRRI